MSQFLRGFLPTLRCFRPAVWKMAVYLAVAGGDIFDGVLFCTILFPREMSWVRSGAELSQFLRIVLPTPPNE